MAYATCADVESRWRALTSDERGRAEALIEDASAMLRALVTVRDGDEDQAKLLRQVCCSMVIRSMVAGSSDAFGVDEQQATMGPFGQRVHYANPNGDMYLTKLEKRLLGIGGGRGRVLCPSYGTGPDD